MGRCDPGLKHVRTLRVTEEHTAVAVGSGDMPVFATPALLALAEAACVEALVDELDPAETTVGTWAEVEHTRAAPVGASVCAHATLIGHHNRRLEFRVAVEHDGVQIALVKHRRVLVDRARFMEKMAPTVTGC